MFSCNIDLVSVADGTGRRPGKICDDGRSLWQHDVGVLAPAVASDARPSSSVSSCGSGSFGCLSSMPASNRSWPAGKAMELGWPCTWIFFFHIHRVDVGVDGG